MPKMTLSDVSKSMKDIDYCMLSTRAAGGEIAGRPMSTNGDVDYQGDSYFFASEDTHTVQEIDQDPEVALSFSGSKGILGQRPLFIAIEGHAELIREKQAFRAHWTKDLDRWFDQGVDTPNLVLIKVHATRLTYWNGTDEGDIAL